MHQGLCRRADSSDNVYYEMVARDHELEKIIRVFLDEVQKRCHVDSAYLFGSYAKGT